MRLEILVLAIVALFASAFIYVSSTGNHAWEGADSQAEGVIQELTGGYEPWFSSVWEPPSGEIESLLFALQASIGSIIIGYFLGYYRALSRQRRDLEEEGSRDAQPSR
ncbi:MAG: energy-coupling factor ABC transporter substrate-binding protein [Methanothrix sp.]|nr:energy-coupling factor ABC transporter substrate-binding protein [Methanothrix sp.]